MKIYNYHDEIPIILKQFEYAFNNILVKRYNKENEPKDTIRVRFIYAPKQKVLYDLVDLQQNFQVPAIAINVTSITRDDSRMANMILPNSYTDNTTKESNKYNSPLPINISIDFSIITRDEQDMWQIISNFAPYHNPYMIISWEVPKDFGLPDVHEIRTEVHWGGNISFNFPLDVNNKSDMIYNASTNFTIKSFLFKPAFNPQGIILKIDSNFYAGMDQRDYTDNSLSAIQAHEQYDATVINTPLSTYKITRHT